MDERRSTSLNSSDWAHMVSERHQTLLDVAALIQRYYLWVIFVIGFPGNLASVLTIIRMKPATPLTCNVALLAVVDNITLVIKLLHLLLQDYNLKVMMDFECKILTFLGNVFLSYASWIVVLMSVERFVAVWYPLKLGINWTIKRSFISVVLLFLILALLYLHLVFTTTSYKGRCEIKEIYHNYFITEVWHWISALVYAILPCCLLFVFNILIIIGIRKSANQQQTLTTSPSSAIHHRDVTVMLIVVSIVFLVLTIPICVLLLLGQTWSPTYSEDYAHKILFRQIAYVLCDSNHAVNFFLYFLGAKRFRRHFKDIFKRCALFRSDTAHPRTRTTRCSNNPQFTSSPIHENNEPV